MSKTKDVVFPPFYREGQTIYTKAGPVTVGKHRKATLTEEQHAALLAQRGEGYFSHSWQDPTPGELEADAIAAAKTRSTPPAQEPSAEYERHASAAEAVARAKARGQQALHDDLAATAAASAQTSETGDATVDLGGGVVAGGRSAALSRKAERAAAAATWDAEAEGTTSDAGSKLSDATATP